MSGKDVHLMLKTKIAALPQIRHLSLMGSDGKLINTTSSWPVPLSNIADRAYFKALKAAPQLTTAVSEPVLNRLSGTWTTIFARNLIGSRGEFWQASNSPSSKISSHPWRSDRAPRS
jgi:hypothetical protein